jgi:hypothetical protein
MRRREFIAALGGAAVARAAAQPGGANRCVDFSESDPEGQAG